MGRPKIKIEVHADHDESDNIIAEKDGCPICKKLVRIFDGRNLE